MKMKKENVSTIGSVIVSLLATSCCIGPAIFVVFGTSIGIFGKMSFFTPIKPYLLSAAFLMLGFSFWKLYLKKADCTCKEDIRVRKIARIILWIGVVALVFAISFQKILLWIYS